MARLQILVLPDRKVGNVSQADYILIIDEAPAELLASVKSTVKPFSETTGGRGVLVFESRIDVIQTWDHISPDD